MTWEDETEVREVVWRIKDLADDLFSIRGLTGPALEDATQLASLAYELGMLLDFQVHDFGITSNGATAGDLPLTAADILAP